MKGFFNPKSVAVIGASRDKTKVGHVIYKNLLKSKLKVYPINPKAKTVLGNKAYSSVKEVPGKIDLAVIAVPAKIVPLVINDCGAKSIKNAIVISAGFKEVGNKELEDEIVKIARISGVRILGPNVLGVIKPGFFNASFFEGDNIEGGISFISQSGALGVAVLDWAIKQTIGFRYFISIGNMADVNFNELIDELNNDPKTKVIALYIEALINGKTFMKSVSNSKKPVLLLKAGSSIEGSKAASSHTGSLAGSNEVYEAAFKQCGARVVSSFNDLIKSAELINKHGLIGRRVLIIANAGGPSILMTDACVNNGLLIPKLPANVKSSLNKILPPAWSHNNPIDIMGDALADRYEETFNIIKKDDFYDSIIVILTPQAMTEVKKTAESVIKLSKSINKPVIPCFLGGSKVNGSLELFEKNGVFAFNEINEVADALKNAVKD